MGDRITALVLILAAALHLSPTWATAGVVVVTNRADCPVAFTIIQATNQHECHRIAPGDTIPFPVTGPLHLACEFGGRRQHYTLAPDSIYFFAGSQEQLRFSQLLLSDRPPSTEQGRGSEPEDEQPPRAVTSLGIVPVKILVDDEEPTVQRIWEQRLRERLAKASELFERLFHIRFEVRATGTWDSDDALTDFHRSLAEFEAEATPAPATLAIGLTSQYPANQFSSHLGGTRGPLYPYVLIREWSPQITETERLEILVHELGHVLGAAHSSDDNSAMRPKMTDRRARARSFRITFDPLNTLAMSLVAEEVRLHGAHNFLQFRPETHAKLRSVYAAMSKALPDDTATARFVTVLDKIADAPSASAPEPEPLAAATQTVLQAIVAAARENEALRQERTAARPNGPTPRTGDQLTEHLIRQAAVAAKGLPADFATRAFLLGLGIGLDDSSVLRDNRLVGRFSNQVESIDQRKARLAVLGEPTLRGRRDLAKHFVVSAALAVQLGPPSAETIGIFKELRDSQGGTGFSFVDLQADLAGVTLASQVQQGHPSLDELAASFAIDAFVPSATGLQEGLTWQAFTAAYGSVQDDRFLREVATIRERILALPGYQRPAHQP